MVKKSPDKEIDISLIENLMINAWPGRGKEAFLDRDTPIPSNTGVVVFDGSCKSCQILAKAASHFDSDGRFVFVRNDHPCLTSYRDGITLEDYQRDPYLFLPDGSFFKAAEAMQMAIKELQKNLPPVIAMAMTMMSIDTWYDLFYKKRADCTDNSCSQEKTPAKAVFSFQKHTEFD